MADNATPNRAAGASAKAGRKAKKRRSLGARIAIRTLQVTGIGALVLALIATIGVIYFYQTTKLPDPNADFQTQTTFIYYRDGETKMGNFRIQNRQSIAYDEMPAVMKDAVVAAENRDFWTDPGISVGGIARAAYRIARGGEMQGGSTITQQYIKILYLDSERTLSRKVRELMLAIKMGKEVPKEQILEGYLNTIYFGRGAYGIQAASRAFFLTDAKNLTVPQAAVLASVLNNPAGFDPSKGDKARERLLGRYQYVLDGMLEMGKISKADHDKFFAALPEFPDVPVINRMGGPQGFLLTMVRDELAEAGFSEAQIDGGGLKVVTTFDKKSQDAAVATAQKYTAQVAGKARPKQDAAKLHVAIASVGVGTGEVLAMYGGPDYVKSQRNWATTARPSASTFKTYALVAGLRNGFSLDSTFNGNTFTPRGDTKTIRNEFGHQYGREVSLERATAKSINTAFVDLVQQIPKGPNEVVKAANDAGAPTGPGWDLNNRIPLGTAEVSPLNIANSYGTFGNNGTYVKAHVVSRVEDASGKVLYTADVAGQQTIEADVAKDTTYALKSVVDEGTGARVRALGRDIAGKTGTSGVGDAITSAWFAAYTKQVSTAVMYVADDSGSGDLHPYRRPGDGTFFGGTYPAMTWLDFMKVATEGQEKLSFDEPANVNRNRRPTRTATSAPTTRPAETPRPTPTTEQPTEAPTTQEPTTQPPETKPAPTPTPEPTTQPTTKTPKPTPTRTQPAPTPTATKTQGGGPKPTEAPSGQ